MIRLALAVVCLLGLGGFIYLTFRPADKRPVVKGYCPDCGMELPKWRVSGMPVLQASGGSR
jgi:hypothetical protein